MTVTFTSAVTGSVTVTKRRTSGANRAAGPVTGGAALGDAFCAAIGWMTTADANAASRPAIGIPRIDGFLTGR